MKDIKCKSLSVYNLLNFIGFTNNGAKILLILSSVTASGPSKKPLILKF